MTTSCDAVRLARGLVGAPFRPQGRDADTGLDCIGLAILAFGIPNSEVRRDYRLRGGSLDELNAELSKHFRRIGFRQRKPGDLLVCRVSADQVHLAIDCGRSFVHAHAGLRRVAETPGAPPWPVLRVFRRRKFLKKAS